MSLETSGACNKNHRNHTIKIRTPFTTSLNKKILLKKCAATEVFVILASYIGSLGSNCYAWLAQMAMSYSYYSMHSENNIHRSAELQQG